MYIFGGCNTEQECYFDQVEMFNFVDSTWRTMVTHGEDRPSERCAHCAIMCDTVHMLVFGGFNSHTVMHDMYLLHMERQRWTRLKHGTMDARCFHSAVCPRERQVLVFGGWDTLCKATHDLVRIELPNDEHEQFWCNLLQSRQFYDVLIFVAK